MSNSYRKHNHVTTTLTFLESPRVQISKDDLIILRRMKSGKMLSGIQKTTEVHFDLNSVTGKGKIRMRKRGKKR